MLFKVLSTAINNDSPYVFLREFEVAESLLDAMFGISSPHLSNVRHRSLYSAFLDFLSQRMPELMLSIRLFESIEVKNEEGIRAELDTIQKNPNTFAVVPINSSCLGRTIHTVGLQISSQIVRVFSDGHIGILLDNFGNEITVQSHLDLLTAILQQPHQRRLSTMKMTHNSSFKEHVFFPDNTFQCTIEAILAPFHYLQSMHRLDITIDNEFLNFICAYTQKKNRHPLIAHYNSLKAGHILAKRAKDENKRRMAVHLEHNWDCLIQLQDTLVTSYRPDPKTGLLPILPISSLNLFRDANRYVSKSPLLTALLRAEKDLSLWELSDPAHHRELAPAQYRVLLHQYYGDFFSGSEKPEFASKFDTFTTAFLKGISDEESPWFMPDILLRYVSSLTLQNPSLQIRKTITRLIKGIEQKNHVPHVQFQLKNIDEYLHFQDIPYAPPVLMALIFGVLSLYSICMIFLIPSQPDQP